MSNSLEEIKKLRERTGAGMMDCKKALEESKGDFEKAIEVLRTKGAATAAKRAERDSSEGYVAVYSHGGRIGAMVEVNSETDFVARNEDFQNFAKEIAMQVAAGAPLYVRREDVPADLIEKEKKIELEKIKDQKKPPEVIEKIISGKIDKFMAQVCLMEQPYIKDPDITIQDFLNDKIASIGEKITISQMARFEITGGPKKC